MDPANGSDDSDRPKWIILLENHAGKAVIAGWVLVALIPWPAFLFYDQVMTRFPRAQFVPYVVPLLLWEASSLWVGAAVALFSTIAFALRWRLAAALAVVGVWTLLLLIGAFSLASTEPGPEQYVRYVGSDRYLVPWQYNPSRMNSSGQGFTVRLCAETLKGDFDRPTGCRPDGVTTVRPRENGLAGELDPGAWLRRHGEMERIPPVEGHEGYQTRTAHRDEELLAKYYVLRDAQGNLIRLTYCRDFGCRHYTLIDGYSITYDAPPAMMNWVETDKKLAELVASWRVAPSP